MAETIKILQKVQDFPHGLHWFCPRQSPGDNGHYYPEDLQNKPSTSDDTDERSKRIVDAERRKSLVFESFTIFAYDGEQAVEPQKWLETHLNEQMTQCDVCVREFHRGRRDLKQKLMDDYDERTVKDFLDRFDEINISRIKRGLLHALHELRGTPPERRNISSLDSVGLYAVFEALNCIPIISDEDFLSEFFDESFRLVQSNRLLKMNNYTPAMTYFLFSRSSFHSTWALKSWQKFRRIATASEFEWSVREPLLDAMMRVQLSALEKEFLPKFWAGVEVIVKKLDSDLITHSLRAMEFDVCKLALEHLQVDSDGFGSLLGTVHQILEVSPTTFWESMVAIPLTAWTEQFFGSPTLSRLLRRATNDKILDELFLWMIPFVASIQPVHQASACCVLVKQLMGPFQSGDYVEIVRTYCFRLGLGLLAQTLQNLNQGAASKGDRAATSELLEEVERHINRIVLLAKKDSSLSAPCANIIRQVMEIDCKCLLMDKSALDADKPLQKQSCTFSPSLWEQITRSIDSGNTILAKNLLRAVKALVGVEKFLPKRDKPLPKDLHRFNEAFDAMNSFISDILERINDFDPSDLRDLFSETESANDLIIETLSSNVQVRSTGLEIIVTLSGELGQRDALSSLLNTTYSRTMNALSMSLNRMSHKKVFAPAPSMLRLYTDIFEILCNSQDGILRSRTLSNDDMKATENFWQAVWQALATIFLTTETWSNLGHDKEQMQEFCRHTMEFAEKAFADFPVFAGALGDGDSNSKSKSAGKRLTEHPRLTMNFMVKWLKLRDEFLVSKSAALIRELLVRLQEFDKKVGEASLSFIVEVVLSQTRTKLSLQQKAELQRAVEIHLGFPLVEEEEAPWPDSSVAKGSSTGISHLIAANSGSVEKRKALLPGPIESSRREYPTNKLSDQKKIDAATEFKRKREQEMAEKKKRDAQNIAQARNRLNPKGAGTLPTIPKGSGMMVSSDEEESEESGDDLDKELFGIKVANTSGTEKTMKLPVQRPKGPVKKQRLIRSSKDMRARLAPDLSPLHKSLLGWEYFYDGAFPPNSSQEDYTSVLKTFRDPVSYQKTFQPLLILEAWNSFLKAKEENASRPYEVKVVNRSTVDAFLEVSSTMPSSESKEIAEGDIVLISRSPNPTTASDDPHCLARVSRMTRKKSHVEVLYKVLPDTRIVPLLVPNATLHGAKITSVIPLEREYGALLGLKYYDLCDEIAAAKPSPLLKYSDERLQPLMRNYGVNKAQAQAIRSAIDNDAFTLVQGPPGSGKTKTIVAIVGALLNNALRDGAIVSLPRPQFPNSRNAVASPPAKKLLICAPSNAAVDELVMRFKEGVKTVTGEHRQISIVRLGRSDAINTNVIDVTLDELVNKKLNLNPVQGNAREVTQKIMMEHQEVSEKLRDARAKLTEAEESRNSTKELKEIFDALRARKATLTQLVDNAKSNETASTREAELNRRRAQQQIIEEAHVICATLSGSGHDMFQSLNVEFETVVIDEAAQCVELSALIPLKYGCAKCILVGDPQQLPPTVFSREAARFKYEQSLFVRMQSNHPLDVHLLDTQYRMHPDISIFPSQAFYDGRLLDGKDMAILRSRPWHATPLFSPFRFFDVQGQHQSAPKGHSLVNHAEIRVAIQLYTRLTLDFKDYDFTGKIGIITPYKSQLRQLKDDFKRQFGAGITESIEFNTTDAFQGRESEIIIFSCVRASPAGGIGFLQDIRRMNVGLTRAKSSMWVLGNSHSLSKGEYWGKLVKDAKDRGRFSEGDIEGMLARPSFIVKRTEDKSSVEHAKIKVEQRLENVNPNNVTLPHSKVEVDQKRYKMSETSNNAPKLNVNKYLNDPRQHSLNDSNRNTTIPSKRKLPFKEDRETPLPSNYPTSTTTSEPMSSDSSDTDVEMTDVPEPAKRPALLDRVDENRAPTKTKTNSSAVSKNGVGGGGGVGNGDKSHKSKVMTGGGAKSIVSTAPAPKPATAAPRPAGVMKRKKPKPSIFMAKKAVPRG